MLLVVVCLRLHVPVERMSGRARASDHQWQWCECRVIAMKRQISTHENRILPCARLSSRAWVEVSWARYVGLINDVSNNARSHELISVNTYRYCSNIARACSVERQS